MENWVTSSGLTYKNSKTEDEELVEVLEEQESEEIDDEDENST